MSGTLRILSVIVIMSLSAATCGAQLTVATDALQYAQGDTVRITIHNDGPSNVYFNSFPAYILYNLDTQQCYYGCMGLPEFWQLPIGGTLTSSRDTGAYPDAPGSYGVSLNCDTINPDSILVCHYDLTPALATEEAAWGRVKALYR